MRSQLTRLLLSVAAAGLVAVVFLPETRAAGQAQAPAAQGQFPRMRDGKPDLNGIWQAMNTAYWDLEGHGGEQAPKEGLQLGAVGAIPPGLGVVEGGRIPYQPWALAKRQENRKSWVSLDPEVRCYLPGIPRATYLPYPFQIFQGGDRIVFAYQYSYARRIINMGKPIEAPVDSWMGWANGRWEGNTLVIENTAFIEPPTLRPGEPPIGGWLDRTGNFHSPALHVVERYTPTDATHLMYEATLEDPKVYTRPWKITMPLYKHVEKDAQLLEFKCPEYVEELYWGKYRKQPSTR
jgi:hypothetical protein